MKKLILLLTLTVSLSYASPANDFTATYAKGVNAVLFFTSEDMINSGYYTFDDSDSTLATHFFPFTYQFKSDSNFYNFYVNGSIGFSDYRENIADDSLEIKSYAFKVGGGVRLNIFEDTDMMVGAAYIYSKVDSDFSTSLSSFLDIDEILNSSKVHDTYELSASIGYHPIINEYQPYVRAGVRYLTTNIDSERRTVSDTTSVITKLKAGVITPAVTTIYGLPLKLEFYASEIFLAGDMHDILGINNFFVLGTKVHLASPLNIDYIKEVTLDINMAKGNTFDGFNFGLGVSF